MASRLDDKEVRSKCVIGKSRLGKVAKEENLGPTRRDAGQGEKKGERERGLERGRCKLLLFILGSRERIGGRSPASMESVRARRFIAVRGL